MTNAAIVGLVLFSTGQVANAGLTVLDDSGQVIRHVEGAAQNSPWAVQTAKQTADAAAATEAWTIRAGDEVSETLKRWADKANWQVSWEVDKLISQGDLSIGTDFEEAVDMLIDALNRGGAGIRGSYYEDPRALTRTLRITENIK